MPLKLYIIAAEDLRTGIKAAIEKTALGAKEAYFDTREALIEEWTKNGIDAEPCLLIERNCLGAETAAFISQVKRTASWHHTAIVFFEARAGKIEEIAKKTYELAGAGQILDWPLEPETLKSVLNKISIQILEPEDLRSLDEGFADDSLDQIEQAKNLLKEFNEANGVELYRIFHSLKGGSRSLNIPHLGNGVHHIETVLSQVKAQKLYQVPEVVKFFHDAVQFLGASLIALKERAVLPQVPETIFKRAELFKLLHETGMQLGGSSVAAAPVAATQNTLAAEPTPEAAAVTSKSSTVRLANEKLDELQNRFKKVQQIRLKMNTFAQQLKSEFNDEAFPNDLLKLTQQLNEEASSVLEFFISLRVVSATRLKTFASRVLTQSVELTQKEADLEFMCDSTLEIDQAVVEVLETGLTHLIRNSIDHGLEAKTIRLQNGKPEMGHVKLDIQKDGRDFFIVKLSDDGGGINIEGLKKATAKKGVISEADLNTLSDDAAVDLIFVDGLSIKDEVSELSGRGVGLGAVKKRITDLGGSIKAKTIKGEGTSFEIRLPRIFQL